MIFEVVMYGESDEPVAKAFVEALTLNEAHTVALRLMRKQYPNLDPQSYNQLIASEILYRTATE